MEVFIFKILPMKILLQLRPSFWAYTIVLIPAFFPLCSCNDMPQYSKDSKEAAKEMNKPNSDATRESDERFLVKAAEINFEEIRLGQLAEQKGTAAEVKELARMVVQAHNKAKDDLHALSSRKGIAVPLSPSDAVENAYKNLNEKSGHDFDKEYCNKMVSGHKDAIDLYESATRGNNDPDVKSWASSMLPALRTHLAQAQACDDKLKQIK